MAAKRSGRVPAAADGESGETMMPNGEPISALPNWDPARRVLVVHRDHDAGSAYRESDVGPSVPVDATRATPRPIVGDEPDLPTLNRLADELIAQIEAEQSAVVVPNGLPAPDER